MNRKLKIKPGYEWGFVLGSLVALYLLINLVLSRVGGFVGIYVVQPILWGLLAFLVLRLPKYRAAGELRLRNLLIKLAIAAALLQIFLLIIAGALEGFGRSPYSFTPQGIITNLIFVGATIIGIELSRAYLVRHLAHYNTILILGLLALLYTMIMTPLIRFMSLSGAIESIEFFGSTCLPLFAENLLASLLAFLGGPLASIAYWGTLQAFEWFCPILPNLPEHITALVGTVAPVMGFLIVQHFYSARTEPEGAKRKAKGERSFARWIAVAILGVVILWFCSGLFILRPTVIYSGSMRPAMDVGDIALVSKTSADAIKQGDIVQYYQLDEKTMIVHRVIDVRQGGNHAWLVVKGDANEISELVHPSQIVGKIIFVVPKIGWVPIAIKNLVF
jgi:signal peptidase